MTTITNTATGPSLAAALRAAAAHLDHLAPDADVRLGVAAETWISQPDQARVHAVTVFAQSLG